MILTRIQIENYKQYQGSHDIEVPAQATIGVIGENGTGKTTLFEAIEWCLYSPRTTSPADIRPRGFTGHTTVTVHLESADSTKHFIVERVLKRTPSATIFRVDTSGEIVPIVQGPRQVSDYVSTKLIGLSHTAFTATFFTRQKELHLFGDETSGKRRQEVGRLLGLETIRSAQKSIVNDRSNAAADSRAMVAQYDRESEGRDFAAELGAAVVQIDEHTSQLAAGAEAIATTERSRIETEAKATLAQERRNKDIGFGQQLESSRRERQSVDQRLAHIAVDLKRLESREHERLKLAPIAANLDPLRHRIVEQEKERARFEHRNELVRQIKESVQRSRELNGTVRDVVNQIRLTSPIEGWTWSDADLVHSHAGARRLVEIVNQVDLHGAEQRERIFRDARATADELGGATEILTLYRTTRETLDQDEQKLLLDGEPREKLPDLDRDRDRLHHDRTTIHANRTTMEADLDKARIIVGNLERRKFGDDCPTCGRPFSEDDVAVVTSAMRDRMSSIRVSIEQFTSNGAEIDRQLTAIETRRAGVFTEIEQIENLRQRILKSVSYLDGQRETVDKAEVALAQALAAAELKHPPKPVEIARVESIARELRQIVGARSTLNMALESFEALESRIESATADRDALGEIGFDPDAFRQLTHDFQAADRAQSAISQIEQDVARRPDLESEFAATTQRLGELDLTAKGIAEQRTTLAYGPDELSVAQSALSAARDRERATVERFHRGQTALRESELRRDAVVKEQDRLERLAKSADAKRSEADHLDFIAKEFTEFERYAAGRKRPVLAEYTSHLVNNITDGKYDRVDFDQDFGIIVYDGDDLESSYAVDTFSGGERDAITLAARIALSRMIGHQAANPPGFLVLDEVFGSLDTDRRAHLLDLLGSISNTFAELKQFFIIIHFDDVRTSPALDELWRVEETADGSSMVTSLRPGADIDTL
ncbi:DNA double-strand break repair ATPase Rad50 [soil metagenome]